MITKINEFKKTLIIENNDTSTRETSMTIDEFFSWYLGDKNYENDLDIIYDSLFIYDNELIELTEENLNELLNNKNEIILIESDDVGNVIDNQFTFNSKTYTIDSMDYPGEHNYAGNTNENNEVDWEINNSTASIKFIYPPKSGSLTKQFIDFIYNNPGSTRQDFYKFINREYTPGNNSQFFAGIKDTGILELIGNKYYIGPNYGKWTQGKLSTTPKQISYPWHTR